MSTIKSRWNPVSTALEQTSYGELARVLGLTTSGVSRILRGLRNPAMDTARRLAKELGVTTDQLLDHISAQRGAGRAESG